MATGDLRSLKGIGEMDTRLNYDFDYVLVISRTLVLLRSFFTFHQDSPLKNSFVYKLLNTGISS